MMGMSRSSTCVLAYLMLKQEMTALQALKEVRRHREVRPNDGFLRQLADLDNKLRKEREKSLSEKHAIAAAENTFSGSKFNASKITTKFPDSNMGHSGILQTPQKKTSPSVTWK